MSYRESIHSVAKALSIKSGNFLITGATGLIGTCFIDILLCANELKKCNFTIYALGRSEKKIKKRFGGKVIPIIQDITEPLDAGMRFDYIIHAASNADPKSYVIYPVETVVTNVIGTKVVLDYCVEHKESRMLLTSTFEVYGKIDGIDVYKENMSGTVDFQLLRNGYTESKRCAEILVQSYVDEYGVDAVIVRLPSVYGPTMLENDSKAHAQFIRNALNGENIVLKSEGLQKRNYCYVIDAVTGIFTVLLKGKTGESYNVSNENSVARIVDVATVCADIAGKKVVFEIANQIEAKGFSKPQNCILDNAKLKELGWSGKYRLREGMEETLKALGL